MKILFLAILLLFAFATKAQSDSTLKKSVTIDSKTFMKVEIESGYPGGVNAWAKFLQANLSYPSKAVRKKIEGDVVVQFIVDKEGNVSNVEAISGPENGGLREEAMRVISISGRWTPAVQDGRKVKSYKKQPISFRLR